MRASRPLPIVAAAAILALAVAASAVAQGQTVKIDSSISIKEPKSLVFKGKVKADNPNCVEDRKVVLYAKAHGGSADKVGKVTTDSDGKWKIKVQGSAGITMHSFYAEVKKVSQGTAGTIYVCKGAKSEKLPPETS